jgi:excinuclease UvrABC nuclease subunit
MKPRYRTGGDPGPAVDHAAVRHFVYRLHGADGDVIYVGRSCEVAKRIRAHKYAGKAWLTDVRSVSMFGPMSWDEAVAAERREIARLQPPGNVALTVRDHRPFVAHMSQVED